VSEDKKFDNNRKGYLALFRLQAQIYNVIPRTRTLTCSDDFTYINSAEKKRRKIKKIGAKKNIKMTLPEVGSSDSSDHYDTDSEATIQLDYQDSRCEGFLPTNLEEHFEHIVKK
jgi:hypothetical protein